MCQQSLNSQSEAGTILFAVPCYSAAVTVSVAMLEAIVAGSPWGRFTLIAFALNLLIALTGASVAGLGSPVATRQRIN